ncbi:MAG: RagB/SusD family nutrient uptake outer membrane protein [Flavobacterium sp.]|nr:MAG: RagB/SusD family nutrient uptake outer membrane protein [Flavobacterium sp.]
MKMKKYFNLFYFMSLALVMSSCTDDLNVTPEDDDELLADEFYSRPGAYKNALAGVYGNFSLTGSGDAGSSNIAGLDPGTSQYGRCLWYLQCLSTEEAIWSYEADPGTREIQRGIWTSTNPIFQGMFSRAMFEVTLVNEFLRQSTDEKLAARGISGEQLAEMPLYRAEVRVLRALAYYHLMDLFGKATFVTENDPISVTFKGQEYSREQLYTFIESELTEVIPLLKEARTNEYGRVDKAVAQMILAKIYLNAQAYGLPAQYDKCRMMCETVINSGYSLATNYLNNFNADNDRNEAGTKEIIFAFQSDGSFTQAYGPTTVMINGSIGSVEANGEALGVGSTGWGGAIRVRGQFSEKFANPVFNNDARNTLMTNDRTINIVNIEDKASGYAIAKYSNKTSGGTAGPNSTFVDTDFPLFRLADVYLMYAECVLRGGGGSEGTALEYINALRTRANAGSTAGNILASQMNLDFILDERLRELHWESHRRQDLIRFNRFTGGSYNWDWKGNAINGGSLPAHFNVFPLPFNSLNANSNLTQNPNY